jgi:hypothetical protein
VVNITYELIDIIKGDSTPTTKICSAAILRSIDDKPTISMVMAYLEKGIKEHKLNKKTAKTLKSVLDQADMTVDELGALLWNPWTSHWDVETLKRRHK